MTAEVAAQNAAQVAQMVQGIKVTAMWALTGFCIHLCVIRAYMVAWVASGHSSTMKVDWTDTFFFVIIHLVTLALWLDKFHLL